MKNLGEIKPRKLNKKKKIYNSADELYNKRFEFFIKTENSYRMLKEMLDENFKHINLKLKGFDCDGFLR